MKKVSKFVLVVMLLLPAFAFGQVTEEWVARYDRSGLGDSATAMAIDVDGNVLVVGQSGQQGVIIKYDQNGNEIWAAMLDYYPTAIAVDGWNNVYVTGSTAYYYYATAKYDSHGNLIWVGNYDAPVPGWESRYNIPAAIAIDNQGNVYVTGQGGHSNWGAYATIKYDKDGNLIWESIHYAYDEYGNFVWDEFYAFGLGPVYTFSAATNLTIDSQGNVYVIGRLYNGDYGVVKYDKSGIQLWTAIYDYNNGGDRAIDVAVDSNGNVYVTGTSGNDYATVKYDSDGRQAWVARYSASENSNDTVTGLVVDNNGNVFVTGYSYAGWYSSDYVTVKYDTNGNELWVQKYSGPNIYNVPSSIALDSNGNVYVTGYATGVNGDSDYATIKYNTNGTVIWTKSYAGPVQGDTACCIKVDQSGNVFVTGTSVGVSSWDIATVKYSQPQQVIEVQIDIKPGSFPNAIKLQDIGNIPVAIFSTISFDVHNIEVSSLELNGAGVRIVKGKGYQYSFEDVNGDGLLDLVVHFDRGDAQLTVGDTSATVTGMAVDGKQIQGTDSIKVIE